MAEFQSEVKHEWLMQFYEPCEPPEPVRCPYHENNAQQMVPALPPQAQPRVASDSPTLSQMGTSMGTTNETSPQLHTYPQEDEQQPSTSTSKPDNPRENRNKAEKIRRDILNRSISYLSTIVPPVIAAKRKMDKTSVLRLTAHFLRVHQHVFGDTIGNDDNPEFQAAAVMGLLSQLNGFLLTTTYKGLVVVASQNISDYLGHVEVNLLGLNILNFVHEDDREMLKQLLIPKCASFGRNGELLIPEGPDGLEKITEALSKEKRDFVVRFRKARARSESAQYVTCHVNGCFRKSDAAGKALLHNQPLSRRKRNRGENSSCSGNDVVFIGLVRPVINTFKKEMFMESYFLEYRTRHSVDGGIIECDQRISMVTGYMTHEVMGTNAMNFMHRDDVRWVVIALRDMYDNQRVYGESCYRLMARNGQFVYMHTRGSLDVDESARSVSTFVCTNNIVSEEEGKQLIKLMKKHYAMIAKNYANMLRKNTVTEEKNNETLPVENPKQLEKVIFNLVNNLPSSKPEAVADDNSLNNQKSLHFNIIPPQREEIVNAIDRIYTVIDNIPRDTEENTFNESSFAVNLTTQDQNAQNSIDQYFAINNDYNFIYNQEIPPPTYSNGYQNETSYVHEINSDVPNRDVFPIEEENFDEIFAQSTDPYNSTSFTNSFINNGVNETLNEDHCNYFSQSEQNEIANITENATTYGFDPEPINHGMKRPYDATADHVYDQPCSKKSAFEFCELSDNYQACSDECEYSPLDYLFDDPLLEERIEEFVNDLEQNNNPILLNLEPHDVEHILDEIESSTDTTTENDNVAGSY